MSISPSNRIPGVGKTPGSMNCGSASAFYGARESGDVVLDEERVDDGDQNGAEERARHELPPEVDISPDQLGDDAHGHRFPLGRGQEDERVDELVPREREGKDAR